MRRFIRAAAFLLAALVCFAVPGAAQNVTTGSIRGTITDGQGGVLPGADVVAVHEPTGTSSSTVTQADGTYSLLNLQVGPYTVTARLSGFREQSVHGLVVKLGEDVPLTPVGVFRQVRRPAYDDLARAQVDRAAAHVGDRLAALAEEGDLLLEEIAQLEPIRKRDSSEAQRLAAAEKKLATEVASVEKEVKAYNKAVADLAQAGAAHAAECPANVAESVVEQCNESGAKLMDRAASLDRLGDDPGPKEDQNERSQELRQRFTQRLARTVRHVASLKRNAGVYIRLLPSTVQ